MQDDFPAPSDDEIPRRLRHFATYLERNKARRRRDGGAAAALTFEDA